MSRDPRNADDRRGPPRAPPLPVKMGRPITLTAGLTYRLARNLTLGMTRPAAMQLEGMGSEVLKYWLAVAAKHSRALYWTGRDDGQERWPDTLFEIEQIAYDDFLVSMSYFAEEDYLAQKQGRLPKFFTLPDLPCTRQGHWLAFGSAVFQAEAKLQARLLAKVEQAESWQAAAWLLERRWPNAYGRVMANGTGVDDLDATVQKQVVILPAKQASNADWSASVAEDQRERESA